MNNFSVKVGEREYWISRSIAVLAMIKGVDYNGVSHVLAVQRGKGTPDPEFVGKWCLPCGYLDYNETCKEAVIREVFEETGLKLSPEKYQLVGIEDNPNKDKRQNVTFRFFAQLSDCINDIELTNEFSETDEVMDIMWIPIGWIDDYQWAFNHDEIIKGNILYLK